MTANRDLDRQLSAWLDERATASAPDGLLQRSLARVDATRQRPGWLVGDRGRPPQATGRLATAPARAGLSRWGFPSMNRFAPLALAATAVVVIVLIGISLLARSPNVGPSPVPGPTHRTTPEPTAQTTPAMFAFVQQADGGRGTVWVANLDGTGARVLAPDPVGDQDAPAWSPDGTRLVFSWDLKTDGFGYPSGESRLYLTDATGSAPQLVDTGCVAPCLGDTDAAFSSDGKRLVFVRTLIIPPTSTTPDPMTGKPPGDTAESVVATIDLLTGRVAELASTTISEGGGGFQNHRPRWSPDGTQIVFAQDVPFDINGPEINGMLPPTPAVAALFVVDAGGANLHQIRANAAFGDWSPDGGRILFGSMSYVTVPRAASGAGYDFRQYYDIYTVRPDGTDLRQLTSDQFSQAPSWTADGRIGFIRNPKVRVANGDAGTMGPLQFWVMDADGSHATQLSVSSQLQAGWPISWPP